MNITKDKDYAVQVHQQQNLNRFTRTVLEIEFPNLKKTYQVALWI